MKNFLPLGHCAVCNHSEVAEINKLLASGQSAISIPPMYSNDFHFNTLYKHIKECLKVTAVELRRQQKITSVQQVDNEYNELKELAKEQLYSAREVLLVNGELNLHPRAWEVSVVFEHPFIKDPTTNKPVIMTDTLQNVLDLLSGHKIKVKKSMLKMEDVRKTYREALRFHKDILENYFRLFGAYKKEDQTIDEELANIRASIEHAAKRMSITYRESLAMFLDTRKDRLRRDLVEILVKELADLPINITPNKPKENP